MVKGDKCSTKERQTKFAEANPSLVLSCWADGMLRFVNPATLKLLQGLGLESAEDILPGVHKELVKNCLKTSTLLTEERKVGGRTLTWSYRSVADGSRIYIYGHDIT